jgi:hypothetical protein
MYFIVHFDHVVDCMKIVDNTSHLGNAKKQLVDYVAEHCNALHIEDILEVKEEGRYFKVSNSGNIISIFNAVNNGYVFDYFDLRRVEEVHIVDYAVKTYAECIKENLNQEIEDIATCKNIYINAIQNNSDTSSDEEHDNQDEDKKISHKYI